MATSGAERWLYSVRLWLAEPDVLPVVLVGLDGEVQLTLQGEVLGRAVVRGRAGNESVEEDAEFHQVASWAVRTCGCGADLGPPQLLVPKGRGGTVVSNLTHRQFF
jgi:hypothetical protein